MSDLISRQAVVKFFNDWISCLDENCHHQSVADMIIIKNDFKNLPSAQPDERMLHESCTDCPLYDKDRHSCPRFNKVIPVTLRELQSAQPEQRWIPCSERLPEPRIDVWCNSDMGQMVGYYEENVETWYGRDYLELMVTAWMPLPEPYKGGEHDG